MHKEIEGNKKALLEIFSSHLRSDFAGPESQKFKSEMPNEQKAEECVTWLSALLTRAVDHIFYSVSFSDSPLNPMMWAHYADGFKGCVVIYTSYQSNTISLRQNLFDAKGVPFSFLKVNYSDGEKRIPILESAVSGKDKAREAFLQKSAFWSYESEYRLFAVERSNAALESVIKEKKASQRDRIWHHHTNDIIGVIFGPRCDERYKKKVDLTLLDNRLRAGNQPFFLFDTQLTSEGRVVISKAEMQSCPNFPGIPISPEGMHRPIESKDLPKLLADLGIVQDNYSHV